MWWREGQTLWVCVSKMVRPVMHFLRQGEVDARQRSLPSIYDPSGDGQQGHPAKLSAGDYAGHSRDLLSPAREMAEVITRGNPRLPEVALTFDDGPSQFTPQVLAILRRYGAKATFFTIGQHCVQYPGYLRQALAEGMAVGNHTFTHPHLPTLSRAAISQELSKTQSAVFAATDTRPAIFRPPYGEYNVDVLTAAARLGLTVVTWSAAADDWHSPQPAADEIAARILGAAQHGAIFLLHEGGGDRSQTVAALPAIITGLQERGFSLVTIPHLLANRHHIL